MFRGRSLPILYFSKTTRIRTVLRTMIFPPIFPVPVPYFIFKIISVLRTISAPKINFLPVYLTPSVPVLRYGVRYVYGIRTRTPEYGSIRGLQVK